MKGEACQNRLPLIGFCCVVRCRVAVIGRVNIMKPNLRFLLDIISACSTFFRYQTIRLQMRIPFGELFLLGNFALSELIRTSELLAPAVTASCLHSKSVPTQGGSLLQSNSCAQSGSRI